MIMISFKTKREKDDMLRKAREMEKFAAEFVDCLENCEEDYEDEYYYRGMNMRDNMMEDMNMRGGTSYRSGANMRGGRYSYK